MIKFWWSIIRPASSINDPSFVIHVLFANVFLMIMKFTEKSAILICFGIDKKYCIRMGSILTDNRTKGDTKIDQQFSAAVQRNGWDMKSVVCGTNQSLSSKSSSLKYIKCLWSYEMREKTGEGRYFNFTIYLLTWNLNDYLYLFDFFFWIFVLWTFTLSPTKLTVFNCKLQLNYLWF